MVRRLRHPTGRVWLIAALVAAIACGRVSSAPEPAPRDRVPGELSLVTYNVHALPAIIAGDDPQGRLPQIGRLLRRYDVAAIQELWSYRSSMGLRTGGWTFVSGPGIRPGLDRIAHPFATGLAVATRLSNAEEIEVASGQFGVCVGRWTHDNDCWARKGWMRARIPIDGTFVDVYTLHLDSGSWPEDRAVRARQLDSVAAAIARAGTETAVIVAGDFNLDLDTPADVAVLDRFMAATGLRNAGAHAESTWKERLDWILYRSGGKMHLDVIAAGVDSTFQARGRPLSDHPALFTRFAVRP